MRWFRSNIRTGVGLALFALAVQFAVTFSHVHLDALTSLPAAHGRTQATAAAADQIVLSLRTPGQSRHSQGGPDTDCPICALIQLASTSTPSVAPPLPIPVLLAGSKLEPHAELRSAAAPLFAFRARGPPPV